MAVCDRCGSTNVVSINLQLSEGKQLQFRLCHRCESKTWVENGDKIPLEHVLELTAQNRVR